MEREIAYRKQQHSFWWVPLSAVFCWLLEITLHPQLAFREPGGSGAKSPRAVTCARRGGQRLLDAVSGVRLSHGPSDGAAVGGPLCSLEGGPGGDCHVCLEEKVSVVGSMEANWPRCDKLLSLLIPINIPLSHGVTVTKRRCNVSTIYGCRGGSWRIFLGQERRT